MARAFRGVQLRHRNDWDVRGHAVSCVENYLLEEIEARRVAPRANPSLIALAVEDFVAALPEFRIRDELKVGMSPTCTCDGADEGRSGG